MHVLHQNNIVKIIVDSLKEKHFGKWMGVMNLRFSRFLSSPRSHVPHPL